MNEWHRRYGIIGRGKAGWHAAAHNVSSSGGTLDGYVAQADEGALVYDGDGADYDTFARLVISGPMVDPGLAPGTVKRFTDTETAARMADGLEGAFKALAELAQDATYGGLDYVAVDVYEGLLRGVPGVKIGHVRAGVVEWEDAVEPLSALACGVCGANMAVDPFHACPSQTGGAA